MINIIPRNDTQEHSEETTCNCNPKVEFNDEMLIIHNSFDCREIIEEVYEILNG